MEESAQSVITIERLTKLAHEYVQKLGRKRTIIGYRYVISTGDDRKKDDEQMGFLQYVQKVLDEG